MHGDIVLDAAEQHHLRVRRAGVGDRLVCYDGVGATAPGVVAPAGSVHVEAVVHHPAPTALLLAVGAGDKDRFVALAERCTELGVTRLIPLATERARAVQTRVQPATVERARQRAREACKQSGAAWATVVDELTPLESLRDAPAGLRWFLADAAGEAMPALRGTEPVAWLVGPEGGLSEAEVEWCREQLGVQGVRVAEHTLRFDTAAVAVAVVTLDRRYAGKGGPAD